MTSKLKLLAAQALKAEDQRNARQEKDYEQQRREISRNLAFVMRRVRPARPEEYLGWLEKHAKRLPSPEKWHLCSAKFYVAEKHFHMIPLYGASAIQIIVPSGITVICPDAGHCQLFFDNGHIEPSSHEPTIYLPPEWLKYIN